MRNGKLSHFISNRQLLLLVINIIVGENLNFWPLIELVSTVEVLAHRILSGYLKVASLIFFRDFVAFLISDFHWEHVVLGSAPFQGIDKSGL